MIFFQRLGKHFSTVSPTRREKSHWLQEWDCHYILGNAGTLFQICICVQLGPGTTNSSAARLKQTFPQVYVQFTFIFYWIFCLKTETQFSAPFLDQWRLSNGVVCHLRSVVGNNRVVCIRIFHLILTPKFQRTSVSNSSRLCRVPVLANCYFVHGRGKNKYFPFPFFLLFLSLAEFAPIFCICCCWWWWWLWCCCSFFLTNFQILVGIFCWLEKVLILTPIFPQGKNFVDSFSFLCCLFYNMRQKAGKHLKGEFGIVVFATLCALPLPLSPIHCIRPPLHTTEPAPVLGWLFTESLPGLGWVLKARLGWSRLALFGVPRLRLYASM